MSRSQKKTLPRDLHGWIDALIYKPERTLCFELFMLMNDKNETHQGWWDGSQWEPRNNKKIIKWRFLDVPERVMYD